MIMNHASDCAVHNMPAFTAGLCDCGVDEIDEHDVWARDQWDKAYSRGNSGQARREAGRQMRNLIADQHRRLAASQGAVKTSKPGKSVYIELGVWYNDETGEIHIAGRNVGDFHTTVNDKPDSARRHRNLYTKLARCLKEAGAPHPEVSGDHDA